MVKFSGFRIRVSVLKFGKLASNLNLKVKVKSCEMVLNVLCATMLVAKQKK